MSYLQKLGAGLAAFYLTACQPSLSPKAPDCFEQKGVVVRAEDLAYEIANKYDLSSAARDLGCTLVSSEKLPPRIKRVIDDVVSGFKLKE